jgi:hypothetical protein
MKLVLTCQPYCNIFDYDGEPKIRELHYYRILFRRWHPFFDWRRVELLTASAIPSHTSLPSGDLD